MKSATLLPQVRPLRSARQQSYLVHPFCRIEPGSGLPGRLHGHQPRHDTLNELGFISYKVRRRSYPEAANMRPPAHETAGLQIANSEIKPLGRRGQRRNEQRQDCIAITRDVQHDAGVGE